MKRTTIIKHSIVFAGRKTSVSLEDAFWIGLREIAKLRDATLSGLVGDIGMQRQHGNLSSALRLFVLDHYRAQALRHGAQIVVAQPTGDVPSGPIVAAE
jgi:predicted DNA-binding ribbon-helix-helix protein